MICLIQYFETDFLWKVHLEIPEIYRKLSPMVVANALVDMPTCTGSPQLELPRPIPWNQTTDVHKGSTLIMQVIT